MEFKRGIDPFGIRPELLLALVVADTVWSEERLNMCITSINDGTHSRKSLHNSGQAADLRISGHPRPMTLVENLNDALGGNPDFDVVLEEDHIHLEWQPKAKN